jgi:hypothetical protein
LKLKKWQKCWVFSIESEITVVFSLSVITKELKALENEGVSCGSQKISATRWRSNQVTAVIVVVCCSNLLYATLPLLFRYSSATLPLLFRYSSATLPLLYTTLSNSTLLFAALRSLPFAALRYSTLLYAIVLMLVYAALRYSRLITTFQVTH